jgi:hypothetical protein
MNADDRAHLEAYVAHRAEGFGIQATISFDDDQFVTIEVTKPAGGMERSVKRSRKVQDRTQAQALIDEVIRP